MSGVLEDSSLSQSSKMKKPENLKNHHNKEALTGSELWSDGLVCAFEFVRTHKEPTRTKSSSKITQRIDGEERTKQVHAYGVTEASAQKEIGSHLLDSESLTELGTRDVEPLDDDIESQTTPSDCFSTMDRSVASHWVPIGWGRISELVQTVQGGAEWSSLQFDLMDDEDDQTVTDLAAPYWERPAGPTWWCHVAAGHPFITAWLNNARWLHPAVSIALRDESRLISERMKHLLYEVPVRVAGGLLFELLGHSAGDPSVNEDDIPIVLRSWQAQNFLITVLHMKGSASNINVLGITEVQELLYAGGNNTPRTIHEVIAHLARRLARWDNR